MNPDVVKHFLKYKKLKLIKKDNYALYGRILKIEHDSILFESTKQMVSAISLDAIAEITPLEA